MRYPLAIFNIIQDYIKDTREREVEHLEMLITYSRRVRTRDLWYGMRGKSILRHLYMLQMKITDHEDQRRQDKEDVWIGTVEDLNWDMHIEEKAYVTQHRKLRRAKAKETRIKKRARREALKLAKLI